MNMKNLVWMGMLSLASLSAVAQQPKGDTVIIKLANTSKVVFTIQDRKDIEILKHYDFQSLFEDIINRIETNDTTQMGEQPITENDSTKTSEKKWSVDTETDEDEWYKGDEDDDDDEDWHYGRKTRQSFNFDLGVNNYLSNGTFPDAENELYTVKPWGSWYVAANSIQRTRFSNRFFLEWGLGISWYNFKFQNEDVLMTKDDNGVNFAKDTRDVDFLKSKLTVCYVNASLIPVIDFSGSSQRPRVWDGDHSGFRFGLGPYIGYRLDSYSKLVYKEEGEKNKDKDIDNYYLENMRYGVRMQLGYRSTDIFVNYDMNNLFIEGKGPDLNAFSFGVIF